MPKYVLLGYSAPRAEKEAPSADEVFRIEFEEHGTSEAVQLAKNLVAASTDPLIAVFYLFGDGRWTEGLKLPAPKIRQVGVCKLCHKTKPLCDSHYLPRKLYQFVGAPQLRNPQPIMAIKGQLQQSTLQYRDYVFCEDCEGLLNQGGEQWIIQQVPREHGGRFPLREALLLLSPTQVGNNIAVFDVTGKMEFDLPKLVYFGLSIFWRASAHSWTDLKTHEVNLGTAGEDLRQFLAGAAPRPKNNIVITLDVWALEEVLPALYPVVSEKHAGYQRFWFYIPGLVFMLWTGENIPEHAKNAELGNGVISVDANLALSIRQFTAEGLKSQKLGAKLPDMMKQIDKICSDKPSGGDQTKKKE